jgi:hypothetical protein
MSLNFTVQKVEEFQGLPDGEYRAQVDHIEYVRSNYGNYHIVKWKILTPGDYEGATHQERFSVEHESEQVRKIAINNFSRFCVEIGGLKEGDQPTEEHFLYKIANILIKGSVSKKDEKRYANIVRMELEGTKKEEQQAVGQIVTHQQFPDPEKTAAVLALTGIKTLNDEVPF